ncbi:MAG: hypothetical protein ACKOFW_02115, partial [Planctomycetaceae bacterium]
FGFGPGGGPEAAGGAGAAAGDGAVAADGGDLGGERLADPRGLSLLVNLPGEPSQFTYGKSGGDARLAVSLLPNSSYQAGWGVAWAFGWLLLAAALAWLWQRSAEQLRRWLAPLLFLVGAGLWLLTPAENLLTWLGLILAVAGCWAWMQHMLHPVQPSGD